MRKNIFIEVPFDELLSKEMLIKNTIKSSQEFFKEWVSEKYDLFIIYWFDFNRGDSRISEYKKLWKYIESNKMSNLDIGMCSEDVKYEELNSSNFYGVQKVNTTDLEQVFVNNKLFNSIIVYSKSDYLNNPRSLEPILKKSLQNFISFTGIPENDELVNYFLNCGDIVVQLRQSDEHPCVHIAMG